MATWYEGDYPTADVVYDVRGFSDYPPDPDEYEDTLEAALEHAPYDYCAECGGAEELDDLTEDGLCVECAPWEG